MIGGTFPHTSWSGEWIYFSVCFCLVLWSENVGVSEAQVIPEFPLHKGAIGKSNNNRSVKVDFAVFAYDEKQKKRVFLVELKTDIRSLNSEQLGNMQAAKRAGLRKLLFGVIEAAKAKPQRKYAHLIWISKIWAASRLDPDLSICG